MAQSILELLKVLVVMLPAQKPLILLSLILGTHFLLACSSDVPVQPERKRVDLGGYIGTETVTEEDEVIQKRALVNKQHEEIERQAREIEDLKRQRYHNEKMRDYSRKTFSKGDSWTEGEPERWTSEGNTESERKVFDPSDERY